MPQPQRAKEKEKHNQTCKLFLVFQNTDFKNRRLRCLWALQSKHCYCFCLTCHAATANPIRNKGTNCKLLWFFWIFGLWILAFWQKNWPLHKRKTAGHDPGWRILSISRHIAGQVQRCPTGTHGQWGRYFFKMFENMFSSDPCVNQPAQSELSM